MKRIGHKGAHLIEHGNTTASFDAALACGVDLIEFDVIRWRGQLVVAHDPGDAERREVMTLAEGLEYLAQDRFAEIEFDVDMKHKGFEHQLVSAVHRRNLDRRTIVTTMYETSLSRVRESSQTIRRGLTIPFVTRDWTAATRPVRAVAGAAILAHRIIQPTRVARALRDERIHCVMAHHSLVTRRLVESVHRADGELYTWTVDDEPTIVRLAGMGVDGIVSNDPRLLAGMRDAVPLPSHGAAR